MCSQKLLHTHLVVLARAVNCCNLDCYARSCYVTGCQTLRWWSRNCEVVRCTCTRTHAKTRKEASERKAQRRRQANTRQITPNKRGKTLARAHTHTHARPKHCCCSSMLSCRVVAHAAKLTHKRDPTQHTDEVQANLIRRNLIELRFLLLTLSARVRANCIAEPKFRLLHLDETHA